MSAHRRHANNNPSAAASLAMSGAEMLVLQQSVKQYILTRQTRELTDHELQEFEKLRSRLLPSLQRYSQSQLTVSAPSSSPIAPREGGGLQRSNNILEDITERTSNITNRPSSQQGRLPTGSQQQQRQQRLQQQQQSTQQRPSGRSKTPSLYPIASSSAQTVSTTAQKQRASLSTSSQSRPIVALKPSRDPLVKRELSQSNSNISLQPATTSTTFASTPNTSRASTAAKAGQNSDKKRPKFAVYQDKENAPAKRRRRTQAENESDSDKENRDPLAHATTTPTVPRTTTVLGEKTNFVNNVLNTTAGMKNKEVLRNIVASKIVDMAAAAPVAKPRTAKSSQQHHKQSQQQKHQQQKQTRLYPSTPAATTAQVTVVEPVTEKQTAPTRRVAKVGVQRRTDEIEERPIVTSPIRSSAIEESNTNDALTQPEPETSHDCLLLNVKQEPVDNIRPEPVPSPKAPVEPTSPEKQDDVTRVPETPPRNTAGISQVPASVDDDDSTGSFERLLKAERKANDQGPRQAAITEYEDVPDSQASQASFSSADSLEETFPIPEFLLEGLPEDPQHDEAEVTLVDADNPNQPQRHVPTAAVPHDRSPSTSQSSRRNSTLMSTAFADGMWCIEDMKHRISETVCGFQDQWVALESTSHVQFWRLDNDTPSLKSQWVRYIHFPKTSARPAQIFFAPDDSFALVMEASECSFTRLPLQDLDYLQKGDPVFPTYTWTGLKIMSGCKGFVLERESDGSHMIVVAAEEPGSIGFISIPSDEHRTEGQIILEAKAAVVSGTEEPVSSLALIGNTSLVAATFGSTVAVWDVESLEEPVSLVDTSDILLIKPSLVFATVPVQYFEEEKLLGMERTSPTVWPILTALRDSAQSNQCALFAMKGNHIEQIHQYHGSSSISSVCASSRFIAGHVSANGKEFLKLWDISKPDPVIQLSLLKPPSLEEVATRRSIQQQNIWRQQVASSITQVEKGSGKGVPEPQNDLDDLFSSVSTLSPPPDDLSSPPYPSYESSPAAALPNVHTPSPQRRRTIIASSQSQQNASERGSRPPVDWIELTSITAMERKQVQFSIHTSQQWVVIVQKSMFKRTPSVIHILDLMSILSPSPSPSSSP
ncbi:hypothetical protein EC991_004891 [Linnemannia zychae]|nr:hypothetical protein EC991_004891 [Linnemannia zychae]